MLRQQQLFYRDMVLQQGYELSHCIKLLSSEAKALDKYTSEELGFGWLECSVDGIEALIKFANGTEKHDKKLMEMWNILKNYQTANVLSAYSTGTCKSIPSGEIFFIVVEHVDSTLEEFVKHELRLFEQMEDKYEPSDELKKIILDIGSTLDAFSRDGYSFEKFECKDIYIRTDEDATCVKLGKGVSIGKCYPCKLLADLIDEIFEMARKQPSILVQNLSYLLRSHAGNMSIPKAFFSHPIFLDWSQKVLLLLDVQRFPSVGVSNKMESLIWHDNPHFREMGSSEYKKDKVKNVVGQTKAEFLKYVENEVPHFWGVLAEVCKTWGY